jgi:hypothetical protein
MTKPGGRKAGTMTLIRFDNLSAGMLLAKDVFDRSGRLLLAGGTELTPKHIRILQTWGVPEVEIDSSDAREMISVLPEEVSQEQLAAAEELLRKRFSFADLSHPAMKELFHLSVLHKVQYGNR